MTINYTALLAGKNIKYKDNIIIYVPKINDMVEMEQDNFMFYVKPFTVTTRELFSGMPEIVDEVDEKYPTLLALSSEESLNESIGKSLCGKNKSISDLIIEGLSFWTREDKDNFRILSNGKIINEKLDWVFDSEEYEKFSKYISVITLTEPNEDLIAPKHMSKAQMKIWTNLYKGRVRKLQKAEKIELGDKILILQGSANAYIPFEEIGKMNYYQFSNLLNVYMQKEISERDLIIYSSYKFETSKMKLTNWRENISLKKLT